LYITVARITDAAFRLDRLISGAGFLRESLMNRTDELQTVTPSRWRIKAHPVSWWTLLITTLAILMTSIDAAILPAVLPFVKDHFGLTDSSAGFVNSLFFLGTVLGAFAFGWLSDVVGTGYRRTWVWIAAMALSVIGGVFTFALASSWVTFQIMRVVMGVSRGGSESTNVAIVGEWWQKENRGFAIGTHHIGFPLGQFIGPAVIAAIVTFADWQTAFLLIPLIGVPIMVAQAFLGTKKNQERVYEWIRARGLTPPLESVQHKEDKRSPLRIITDSLRIANLRRVMVVNFGFLWCELGLSTFLVIFLTDRTDMSSGQAILVSGASGLTGWFGQILWGTLSDQFGRKKILVILTFGWIVSILPLLLIAHAWQAWVVLLVWGLFRNAPYPVIYSLVIDSAPKQAGSAMGLMIGVCTGIGGAITSAVTGIVLDSGGWLITFSVLLAGPIIGLWALSRVRETAQAVVAE
jgi:MFS family permease